VIKECPLKEGALEGRINNFFWAKAVGNEGKGREISGQIPESGKLVNRLAKGHGGRG